MTIPIESYDIKLNLFGEKISVAYRFIEISIIINDFQQVLTHTLENQYDFNEKCPECFTYMPTHFKLAFVTIMSELINDNIRVSQPLDIVDLSSKTMQKMKSLENIRIGKLEQWNQRVISEKSSLIDMEQRL